MSAHTALVSLRQILVSRPFHHRLSKSNRLRNLVKSIDLLLNFLEISSTSTCTYEARQVAEVERKMRDAAYRAEHLVNYTENPFFLSCLLIFVVLSPLPARLEVIPVWIPLILVEALICIINAAFLYLLIRDTYDFPTRKAFQEWRRLCLDFKIMVEEVNLIKESSGISALVSLRRFLDSSILKYADLYKKDHLKSLQQKVILLLENAAPPPSSSSSSSSSSSLSTQALDAKFRDAVYKAKIALLIGSQHPMDSGLLFEWRYFNARLNHLFPIFPFPAFMVLRLISIAPLELMTIPFVREKCFACASYMCSATIVYAVSRVRYVHHEKLENQELAHAVEYLDSIVRDVIKIKVDCGEAGDLSPASAAVASSRQDLGCSGRDAVVGLESDMEEIKARLFQVSSKSLELVSIVGMGGIGKTTLARQVYEDPAIKEHFDVRAWTMISQENTLRHVLLSLLDSAHIRLTEKQRNGDEVELADCLYKHLMYRRYLIVVDDVWDTREIWYFLRRHFPENSNYSRVLLTSRLPNVVSRLGSSSHLHHMKCLDENHSWDLLCREVFRVVEDCPLELESIGKKIVRRCGGLPLAIVVVGGLLCKDIRVDVWRDVAQKLEKSQVEDIKEQCLDILSLSYSHLPRHLKPCFLYTGLFLAHCEIHISTLIHLWIAEGFLRPRESKTLEEEAEGYVKDLIDRNLISVSKWSCNGKIRRCIMHDLLRDVCVENARKEKFRYIVESGGYVVSREGADEPPRGLSIDPNAATVDGIHVYLDSVHLRVVNVLRAKFNEFPSRITQLVSLRYLAFYYDGWQTIVPNIDKLKYLETLVLHHYSFCDNMILPYSIWRMPNLRHIYVKPACYMFEPIGFKLFGCQVFSGYSDLTNLQTLVGIRNFRCPRDKIEKLPNLKKLGISYVFENANWSKYQLENLVFLETLETLKITVTYEDGVGSAIYPDLRNFAFPQKLKKLILSGCRVPWEWMTVIGALPNLEALKLRCNTFSGPEWKTVEGQFPRLVFLLLEEMSFTRWETEGSHFPLLQRLVLRSCAMLQEIPLSIGDIPTLELIELVDCHPSAVASAREILEEQESMGNETLKFHIDQRRREVDGMNPGYVKVRGRRRGPGPVVLLFDTIYRLKVDTPLAVFNLVLLLLVFIYLFWDYGIKAEIVDFLSSL